MVFKHTLSVCFVNYFTIQLVFLLFMCSTALFQLILLLFTILSVIIFLFQQNKRYPITFLLLLGSIALFDTILKFHYTISTNFYIYLQYFQQKVFYFNKISRSQTDPKCLFGQLIFSQLILLFSLFFLLFICPTALFGTIHESYCTILTNIYFYLQYFQ